MRKIFSGARAWQALGPDRCPTVVFSQLVDVCARTEIGSGAADGGSVRIQALAETVLRSPSAISRMVVRFETEGPVTRTSDERDRRGTVATITPDGRARLAVAEDTARAVLAEIMQS